jgi:Flp pilus assembly protein TadD
MKLKMLVVVLVIALAGCQQSQKQPTQKEKAVAQWNQARAAVLGSLARSQLESGNLDKAGQTLADALKLDPTNAELHILSGKLAIEQGQLEKADRELGVARDLNPKSGEAEYLAGIVFQRWQKSEMALECYTRAVAKQPSEMAYVLARAETLMILGRAPEALIYLQAQISSFEHNPALFDAVGQLEIIQGKYSDAVASLRKATVLASDDLTIREHLAMAYLRDGQYAQARELYSRVLKNESFAGRSDLWLAQGECQLELGQLNDARNSFEKATQITPTSVPAWLSLAKTVLQLNDTRRAEIVLRKAISIDGKNAEARVLMGYLRMRQSRMKDALVEFQTASTLNRSDPIALCMIGYVLEKQGKTEQATWYYAQALKIKPNDELATSLMASVDTRE